MPQWPGVAIGRRAAVALLTAVSGCGSSGSGGGPPPLVEGAQVVAALEADVHRYAHQGLNAGSVAVDGDRLAVLVVRAYSSSPASPGLAYFDPVADAYRSTAEASLYTAGFELTLSEDLGQTWRTLPLGPGEGQPSGFPAAVLLLGPDIFMLVTVVEGSGALGGPDLEHVYQVIVTVDPETGSWRRAQTGTVGNLQWPRTGTHFEDGQLTMASHVVTTGFGGVGPQSIELYGWSLDLARHAQIGDPTVTVFHSAQLPRESCRLVPGTWMLRDGPTWVGLCNAVVEVRRDGVPYDEPTHTCVARWRWDPDRPVTLEELVLDAGPCVSQADWEAALSREELRGRYGTLAERLIVVGGEPRLLFERGGRVHAAEIRDDGVHTLDLGDGEYGYPEAIDPNPQYGGLVPILEPDVQHGSAGWQRLIEVGAEGPPRTVSIPPSPCRSEGACDGARRGSEIQRVSRLPGGRWFAVWRVFERDTERQWLVAGVVGGPSPSERVDVPLVDDPPLSRACWSEVDCAPWPAWPGEDAVLAARRQADTCLDRAGSRWGMTVRGRLATLDPTVRCAALDADPAGRVAPVEPTCGARDCVDGHLTCAGASVLELPPGGLVECAAVGAGGCEYVVEPSEGWACTEAAATCAASGRRDAFCDGARAVDCAAGLLVDCLALGGRCHEDAGGGGGAGPVCRMDDFSPSCAGPGEGGCAGMFAVPCDAAGRAIDLIDCDAVGMACAAGRCVPPGAEASFRAPPTPPGPPCDGDALRDFRDGRWSRVDCAALGMRCALSSVDPAVGACVPRGAI